MGGIRKKMTNRIRKKYDQRRVRRWPRAMLPYRTAPGARRPTCAVAVVISGLVTALANVAQDQDGGDRQDREHEQRHRGAERQIIAPNAQGEGPGREHMRLIDRTAIG